MYSRTLDVLHDAGDEDVGAVTDGIDLALKTIEVTVHQHRLVGAGVDGVAHVPPELLGARHDGHGTTTNDVGRTYQHRVPELLGDHQSLLGGPGGTTRSLWDPQLRKQGLESLTVLGAVEVGKLGAQDRHPGSLQLARKVDGRLATELDDDPLRLLEVDDVHDVLDGERFEVQLVGDGEVGGHRLRVGVHDDRLIPGGLDGLDRVHGGVVELDALTDADRPGAQHQDAGAIRLHRLVLHLVGRVEVRGRGVELAGAGVDHLVDRLDTGLDSTVAYLIGGPAPEVGNGRIGEAVALGDPESFRIIGAGPQPLLDLEDVGDLVEEEDVDLGLLAELVHSATAADRLGQAEETVVTGVQQAFLEDVVR